MQALQKKEKANVVEEHNPSPDLIAPSGTSSSITTSNGVPASTPISICRLPGAIAVGKHAWGVKL
ncbi:hypothetical protein PG996_016104 [Apiospora saccharicola]|uniref:Uncharacterized protein n=1 Tax=Apiospora saccharicola TaxID=335842 RepID=A0ABR1TMZ6_9PEZI